MADSLTVLRNAIRDKTPISVDGSEIVIGRYRFQKNSLTSFRSSTGVALTIHSIYLCHLNRDLTRGAYVLAAGRAGSTAVAFIDKKELLAYLDGEIDHSAQVVFSTGTTTSDQGVLDSIGATGVASSQSAPSSTAVVGVASGTSTGSTASQIPMKVDTEFTSDISEIDTAKDLLLPGGSVATESTQINKIDLYELDLSEEMTKEKEVWATKMDSAKGNQPMSNQAEDVFIDMIKQKRSAGDMEKSDFILADEKLTKLILSREKQLNDRISLLQISNTPEAFTPILNKFKKFKTDQEESLKKKPSSSIASLTSTGSSMNSTTKSGLTTNSTDQMTPGSPAVKNRTPIIIVPSTLTTPLSIYNIKEFLQSSKFVPTIDKKNELSSQNQSKPTMVAVSRIFPQKKITYEVYDNVRSLKPDDWQRVAAVFVQGEAWQFKDYKWSAPVDLLSHVKGYYLKFDDSTTPDVVKSWDVKVLNISKSKRHLDQTAQIEFWNTLDDYILAKKPFLNH